MGCTGLCCAVLTLNDDLLVHPERYRQGGFIVNMVVPLSHEAAAERAREFGADGVAPHLDGRDLFKCRHWDEQTRFCTVYERRPDMCRLYPYAEPDGSPKPCGWCGALYPDEAAEWVLRMGMEALAAIR